MNELQQACKIIDELICLLNIRMPDGCIFYFNCVDEGLKLIAKRMNESEEYLVTMSLAQKMRELGYLDDKPTTPAEH